MGEMVQTYGQTHPSGACLCRKTMENSSVEWKNAFYVNGPLHLMKSLQSMYMCNIMQSKRPATAFLALSVVPLSCIYKSSPVASQESEVSLECTLQVEVVGHLGIICL